MKHGCKKKFRASALAVEVVNEESDKVMVSGSNKDLLDFDLKKLKNFFGLVGNDSASFLM